jgi:hypothetical protein
MRTEQRRIVVRSRTLKARREYVVNELRVKIVLLFSSTEMMRRSLVNNMSLIKL